MTAKRRILLIGVVLVSTLLATACEVELDDTTPAPDGPVTPDMIGETVGIIGAEPTRTTGDTLLDEPGMVLENVVVNGCVEVEADDVVIRNAVINCPNWYPIKVTESTGITVTHSRIDCGSTGSKGMYFDDSGGFLVERVEVVGCEDQFFIDGGDGARVIRDSVFHGQPDGTEHGFDGAQVAAFTRTRGSLTFTGNHFEQDGGCCANSVIALGSRAALDLRVHGNFLDGDAGYWLVRCSVDSACEVTGNTVRTLPASGVLLAHDRGSLAGCNHLPDGALVPASSYSDARVDDGRCERGAEPTPSAPDSTTSVGPRPTSPPTSPPSTTRAPTTTTAPTTTRPSTSTIVPTTLPPTTLPPTTVPSTTLPPTSTVAPPPPPGDFVTPADIGRSVGATSSASTHQGDMNITADGTVIENTTVNGCIRLAADRVTIRNVTINCHDSYPIKDDGNAGTRVERVTIDCHDNTSKGIYFDRASSFTVDRIHITRCDDQFFIDGGLGNSSITNSVFHNQAPASDAHTDGMQVGTFETTTGSLTVDGNWWEYNRTGCCENGVLFLSGQSALTVTMRHNFFDEDFGTHILRCRPESHCVIEANTLDGYPDGLFVYADRDGGVARCNRFVDGSLIPNSLYAGITVDNGSC